ncbi:hypothetical protein Y1Q_0004074 [Alligator mississippiensis]|uniref:Uncharacterized protein n=1 Tax=Alligator mississippiensis TaxID=8496 RepID=A0A151PI20_ALLMI|nr:hypothetical protein Y1Q_0004074 [Alligator mississippiensis]
MSRIAFVFVMSEPWFRAPEIQAFKSDPENSLRCQAALWDFDIPNDYCAQRMPRLAGIPQIYVLVLDILQSGGQIFLYKKNKYLDYEDRLQEMTSTTRNGNFNF